MKIKELNENDMIAVIEAYENRPYFMKSFKEVVKRDHEEAEYIRKARNEFIREATANILVGRENGLGMADEDYCRMIKNAQLEIDAAEKLDRILNNRFNQLNNVTDHIADAAGGTAEFATDVVLKSPTFGFAKNVGRIARKIFGKT